MIPKVHRTRARAILRYARQEIGDDAKLTRILVFACDQYDGPGDGNALMNRLLEELASEAEDQPTPEPMPTPEPSVDAIDISKARLLGTHARHRVGLLPVTFQMGPATNDGKTVRLSSAPLDWPANPTGKKVDSRIYIFWQEKGEVWGGQFDWKGRGQTSKGMENIHAGYLDGRQPPAGAEVFFALADDGRLNGTPKHRSNVVRGGIWKK